jgi:hypothetical protein
MRWFVWFRVFGVGVAFSCLVTLIIIFGVRVFMGMDLVLVFYGEQYLELLVSVVGLLGFLLYLRFPLRFKANVKLKRRG